LEDEQYERNEVHIYMLGLRRGLVLDDATLGGLIAKLITPWDFRPHAYSTNCSSLPNQ
jgi:hypothetical protein